MAVTLALVGGAVLMWPTGAGIGRRRLVGLLLPQAATPRLWSGGPIGRGVGVFAVAAGAVVIGLLVGPAAGLAGAVAAGCVLSCVDSALRQRGERRLQDAVLESVGALAGELRAGLPPPLALRAAASTVDGPLAATLSGAASTAALGGDAAASLMADRSTVDAGLSRVAAGWRMSARCGASLGEVLERIEGDLRAERAHLRRVEAELAGPRATALLLAALPVLGLGLGASMGARPGHVLLHTLPGQLALLAGTALDAVGMWWTSRIIGAAREAA